MSNKVLCDPAELSRLVKAGDMEALERVTRCHGDRLLAVGRRYCSTASEAEDAVQDALLSAGRNLASFRGEGPVEGWIVRMVANACHRMRRGRKNDPALHDARAVLSSEDASPEEKAIVGEMSMALGTAMSALNPMDRAIVLMAEVEGWTGPEIGTEFGLSAGAVRVRLTRARKRLRAAMRSRLDSALPRSGPLT